MSRLNVLVLYGANATFTNTVMEHLRSFSRHSRHLVAFCSIAPYSNESFPDLSPFDVIVLHYSFFPGLDWVVPQGLEERISRFTGAKLLYLQDEYDNTERARRWMERLDITCLFTCVPRESIPSVYPPQRFPNTDFRTTLTGYVPDGVADVRLRPLGERPIVVGYRGRLLHPRYGDLAREKYLIGARMLELCEARGVRVDIGWTEDKRIYGERWYEFLASCRATLGSESGSNVLDQDGSLRERIDAALVRDPALDYDEIHRRYLHGIDGTTRMNQISPRMFEAIRTKTALVLFEGDYSGILSPDRHYIPLRKDFSNVDEVFRALEDLPALEAMVARAYADVVASGQYAYEAFVAEFDEYLDAIGRSSQPGEPLKVLLLPADKELAELRLAECALTSQPIKSQWVRVSPLRRLSHWAASQTARARRAVRHARGQ
jgi:hypothetical protein